MPLRLYQYTIYSKIQCRADPCRIWESFCLITKPFLVDWLMSLILCPTMVTTCTWHHFIICVYSENRSFIIPCLEIERRVLYIFLYHGPHTLYLMPGQETNFIYSSAKKSSLASFCLPHCSFAEISRSHAHSVWLTSSLDWCVHFFNNHNWSLWCGFCSIYVITTLGKLINKNIYLSQKMSCSYKAHPRADSRLAKVKV